jgi:DNA-binding NarL/FixJ family response regulator
MSRLEQAEPTIVTLDIRLPDMSGIELARLLRQKWPDLKILMLSGYDFDQYVRAAARVGIQGYLLKDAPQAELVQALRAVAAGGAALQPSIASRVMQDYAENPPDSPERPLDELTTREIEVLELMREGLRNAEIGQRLSVSTRTVEAHISRIIAKLGAYSRTEAVRIALQKKLIK